MLRRLVTRFLSRTAVPVRQGIMVQMPVLARTSSSRTDTKGDNFHYVETRGDYRGDVSTGHVLLAEDAALPLYQHQASLPRLVVPAVADSLQTLKHTALPLARNQEEADNFLQACQSFPRQASKLQERLEQRKAENDVDSSWLQQWWNQLGYLQVRDSVVINVSYFFRLDPFIAFKEQGDALALPLSHDILQRGAHLLQSSAKFAQRVRRGTLEPEIIGRSNPTALCSTQYKYLLASCRIPSPKQDSYRMYYDSSALSETAATPRHAIVACRCHFYAIPVLRANGDPVSRRTLERLISECRENAKQQSLSGTVSDLALLTATDRATWAEAYEILMQIPCMVQSLSILQSGICVLCIDEDDDDNTKSQIRANRSTSEVAQILLHGNKVHTSNRWWDKSINWILSRDYCGLVGEHAMVDGMPALNMCSFAFDRAGTGDDGSVEQTVVEEEENLAIAPIFQQAWKELPDQDQKRIETFVQVAKKQVMQRIDELEMQVLEFTGYGLKRLNACSWRPSADAWAQMAMQWASTIVLGSPQATYESTQTRRFLHGRTETIRTVSPASTAWVQSMMEENGDRARQRELLQRALESHVQYTRQASAGEGVDRHFFGLTMCLNNGEEMPDLLQDPLFLRCKRWRMSTSTLSGASPGFGPVVDDGVGIGYDLMHENVWFFTISSRKEHNFVQPMRRELERCLQRMAVFLEDDTPPPSRL